MAEDKSHPSLLVVIPPPVWALAFVLTAWQGGNALGLEPLFQSVVAGWAIAALGLLVSGSGRLMFERAGAEVLPASTINSVLVTTGPFRYTRNPMYLGLVIITIGLALVIGTAAGYAASPVLFLFLNFISIPYEEEKMKRQFGEEYRAYKARVRRWV